ncbi:MAG: glycosyltransferase family 4 protein [Planctomycetia bacterium]|nr:glycosyltransferase family 4 protein [Planctomycetia bacterium]
MHIAIITAGGAGMFCGSCMHDNTWARALMARGVEVSLIPTYTPIRVDEENVSDARVFFGGINVYLSSQWHWWRAVPSFLKHWLDHPAIIRWATSKAVSNDAKQLGQLTLDMLAGESGPQREQVEELAQFIGEQLKPDIVVFSNALLAGSVRRIKQLFAGPVLCVLQGDDIFLDSLPDSHREPVLQALRNRARDFDGFITHSRYYAEHMAAELSIPLDRFHQLPLGIDLTGHDGQPRPAGDPFTVGYFARLCPEKGLHLLVEAFVRFHAKHPRTRLRVSGYLGDRDRSYFEQVRSQAARLGSAFEFVGSPATQAEKVEFLKSLDVLSVPTVYREPKGLSILEALANGVPVVQPAHGAFLELIKATQGGLLFEPGNVDDLTAQLELLVSDPNLRERLSKTGQQQTREKFSAEAMAQQSVRLFERMRA